MFRTREENVDHVHIYSVLDKHIEPHGSKWISALTLYCYLYLFIIMDTHVQICILWNGFWHSMMHMPTHMHTDQTYRSFILWKENQVHNIVFPQLLVKYFIFNCILSSGTYILYSSNNLSCTSVIFGLAIAFCRKTFNWKQYVISFKH